MATETKNPTLMSCTHRLELVAVEKQIVELLKTYTGRWFIKNDFWFFLREKNLTTITNEIPLAFAKHEHYITKNNILLEEDVYEYTTLVSTHIMRFASEYGSLFLDAWKEILASVLKTN